MSNEIYPLEKEDVIHEAEPDPVWFERSVNQRLAPIFRALADDPEGWEYELDPLCEGSWTEVSSLPTTHDECDNFRLVPKRRTITVEIPVPASVTSNTIQGRSVGLGFSDQDTAESAAEAIRSAMEGK